MRSADSVLETLRRGAPEEGTRAAAARLENAIRSGHGHIVVLADSQHEAAVFVDSVLGRVSGFDVSQISARRSRPPVDEPAPTRPTLVVVHDADCADASALEHMRLALESGTDAITRLRFILVGSTKLERTLALPEARALSSRVGAQVRLVRKAARKHTVPVIHRTSSRRWALITSALTAAAAVVCFVVADLSHSQASVLREAVTSLASGVQSLDVFSGPAARGPYRSTGGSSGSMFASFSPSSRKTQAFTDKVAQDLAPARQAISSVATGFDGLVQTAALAAGRAPRTSLHSRIESPDAVVEITHVPVRPASSRAVVTRDTRKAGPAAIAAPAPATGFFASLARLFIGGSEGTYAVETGGAVVETALMTTKLHRASTKRDVFQVGSFSRANSAFALKSTLAGQFDHLAVARFDPPAGPYYSVRVFDLEKQRVETASLGQ
jgi:hypothetical protein